MAGDIIDFLLLGGGLASVTAAETLRAEGAEGSIVILSADEASSLPHARRCPSNISRAIRWATAS